MKIALNNSLPLIQPVNSAPLPSIKSEIRKFVIDTFLFGSDEDMADGTSFLANGIIDSTGVMELVAHLEKTYRIKIKDDELVPENLDSIDSIAGFLSKKHNQQA
jgi:acyl carrier protein